MHRPALDRTGPDQRDFDDEVVEACAAAGAAASPSGRGSRPGTRRRCRPRTTGRRPRLPAGSSRGRSRRLGLRTMSTARCSIVSMPRPSRSNFTRPGGRAVVLVPLEHRAALHARPLDRAELDERPVGHHHAARVDAEVAREVDHLGRELERERRDRRRPRRGRRGRRAARRRACGRARCARTGARAARASKLRGFPHREAGDLTQLRVRWRARRTLRGRRPSGRPTCRARRPGRARRPRPSPSPAARSGAGR